MKCMKKAISLMLILFLTLTMGFPAFAAETEKGSITIKEVKENTEYSIYRMLDLESYDANANAYSYKVNNAWKDFFATDEAKKYIIFDDAGYATWKAAEDDTTKAAFAKLALDYAEDNGIAPVKSSVNDGQFAISGGNGVFSGLELGYYLVDSTMGALCGLTTTKPDAEVQPKNGIPTIDKEVKVGENVYGDSNTAGIGQTVEFRATINVAAGAEDYILHDTMSKGLTFQRVSGIEYGILDGETTSVDTSKYEVVTAGLEEGCTFEVRFDNGFCAKLEKGKQIIVYYEAILNSDAVIAGDNPNEAWLEYGEKHYSNHDTTNTKTYGFDLVKTDGEGTLIDGAEFRIYDAATGGNEIAVVKVDDYNYRRAVAGETGVAIVVKDGQVRVEGLGNGTYYLEETKAPDGYNKLTARQEFTITNANLDATVNGDSYSEGGVKVENKTGAILPETGGMGTMMFITCGMFVVLATGVLLVTKKRMSMIQG